MGLDRHSRSLGFGTAKMECGIGNGSMGWIEAFYGLLALDVFLLTNDDDGGSNTSAVQYFLFLI